MNVMPQRARILGAAIGCSVALGCSAPKTDASPETSATATSSASPSAVPSYVPIGVPGDPMKVYDAVDPNHEAPYAGPTATVRGFVKIIGDPPPDVAVKLPDGACRGQAAAAYGKLFRVGQGGALADAIVAVTGYKGYVPAPGPAAKITIHGCAYARRTLVATFGQRVEVSNLDHTESYMPYLDGAATRAVFVAVPGGDAVKLYPPVPGRYMLRDQLPKDYLTADVFVLSYATHAVTDLDGQYEIKGIPVGKVRVNAMLPVTNQSTEAWIDLKEGDNTQDLTLKYEASAAAGSPSASASASAAASAAPSASATAKP